MKSVTALIADEKEFLLLLLPADLALHPERGFVPGNGILEDQHQHVQSGRGFARSTVVEPDLKRLAIRLVENTRGVFIRHGVLQLNE